MKPFEDGRFRASVRRARQRISERHEAEHAVALGADRVQIGTDSAPLWAVPASILWIESAGHLVLVHMRRRTVHVRVGIGQVEQQLTSHGFTRVHRGALVNVKCVEALQVDGGDYSLRLQDGSKVPVSRRRLDRVREALRLLGEA